MAATTLLSLPTAVHALAFALALSIAFLSFDGSLFGWHPFFMALGYIFFMAEGLVGAYAARPAAGADRARALGAHALLQLRALLFAAAGGAVIVYNKHLHGRPHFKTLHGKVSGGDREVEGKEVQKPRSGCLVLGSTDSAVAPHPLRPAKTQPARPAQRTMHNAQFTQNSSACWRWR